jgi:hypothetical protein
VVTLQWARLKTALDVPLRRGAWYRVVAPVTRLDVVVSVQGQRVSLPRAHVELRATPPREGTLVRNPTVAPERTPDIFQKGYIVCPGCRNRAVLPPTRLATQLCPRCSQTFPIAWDEKYLETV